MLASSLVIFGDCVATRQYIFKVGYYFLLAAIVVMRLENVAPQSRYSHNDNNKCDPYPCIWSPSTLKGTDKPFSSTVSPWPSLDVKKKSRTDRKRDWKAKDWIWSKETNETATQADYFFINSCIIYTLCLLSIVLKNLQTAFVVL